MDPTKRKKTQVSPPNEDEEIPVSSNSPPLEHLPSNIIDEILFKLPQKSLARLKCTCETLKSHISNPDFESEYFSRVGSGLIHVSSFGSNYLCFNPFLCNDSEIASDDGNDGLTVHLPMHCQILASHGGLVLMFMKQLCVFNPITKQFKFLTHGSSPAMKRCLVRDPEKHVIHADMTARVGFAVEQNDRNPQRFKIVCIDEMQTTKPHESKYGFEIYAASSWKKSKTAVSCPRSNLSKRTKPVYFNGILHWLRNNGSILAFEPETEQARVIPTAFPLSDPDYTVWLGAADGRLILILATDEVISVFSLADNRNPEWTLLRSIKNEALKDGNWLFWSVVAYDGKFLVVQETKGAFGKDRVLHLYDVRDKEWRIVGSAPRWLDASRDFCRYVPSWSSATGLVSLPVADAAVRQGPLGVRLSCLELIMGRIDPKHK